MRKETPYLVLYGRTYSEAMEVVHRRRLQHCEPVSDRLTATWFSYEKDLILFKLRFHDEAMFEDSIAVLHIQHDAIVSEFMEDYGLSERVDRFNLSGVWFQSGDDEIVMNQEFSIST
jgi:hypothetical protein